MSDVPPCVLFEDDHLLVVNKPPGWNTHAPSPFAGEGIYEWLKNREPRWSRLAIIHRLDKETSGVLVFSKTSESNRSLTQQFTEGKVRKDYVLRATAPPPSTALRIESNLIREGSRYVSCRGRDNQSAVFAVTEFALIKKEARYCSVIARPRTGRTHQIRVHASESGFPILGDSLYGGAPFGRVCLHSRTLQFIHPVDNRPVKFVCEPDFDSPPWLSLRDAFINPAVTDANRVIHGAFDGFPDLRVEKYGSHFLSQSPQRISGAQIEELRAFAPSLHHKITTPLIRGVASKDSGPQNVIGPILRDPFTIRENDALYEINFNEGYSVGLFPDQRDNRRRLLKNYAGSVLGEIFPKRANALNTFAYTCGFSVCAALAGARTTSLDLSKKYLDWGRRNFKLNEIDPAGHHFIYGDVFDWLKRFAKKSRQFDLVLLDPPTFSQSKESGVFRAETNYGTLVSDALRVLKKGGVLFASTNAARLKPEDFLAQIHKAVASARRKIAAEQYFPQPPDFPISKAEPAYLKTCWFRID